MRWLFLFSGYETAAHHHARMRRYSSRYKPSTEKRLWCEKHQTSYGTHMRLGGRLARSGGCPVCNSERVAEWERINGPLSRPKEK